MMTFSQNMSLYIGNHKQIVFDTKIYKLLRNIERKLLEGIWEREG